MGIQLFGNNPKEAAVEVITNNTENNFTVETLQAEIIQARKNLQESEARMIELQKKLDDYIGKERQIAEVMIAAQISAQKTEAQARARAEILMQETEAELRLKHQELELLQMKAQAFKDDVLDRLDQYKSSLEKIMDTGEETSFTVINTEKRNQKMTG